jgi:HrpA-like RNA helicase
MNPISEKVSRLLRPYPASGAYPTSVEGQNGGEDSNYKAGSQFSSHLHKSEAQSVFAKTRTLKQQREYLPAFAVREELMSQIRDHQGITSYAHLM